ncbi:heavy metal translocating P-type ATPase [Kibdelosporangium aridum]|uniref:Heavy metal-(Cd/Co/Hg/Pb/Zn)-translocating P-type ATPase n=1 Tax=Kibdelosporangium aridum TaxID=2030 RepID=A0A1W2BPW2_KIBAR|nr:heavy metal translocating P-type ATPase [Kibdelosporangium aridum]SMC74987.1 heavy metal-(Cd/Co/Hg/Pb/Zn)-translocating P-type ATPase [Kibdelosporangium aridum]
MFSLPEVRWAVLSTSLFGFGLLTQVAGGPSWLWWSLYLCCYAAGGWEPALSGLKALREKTLDVDLLMVLAAIGAASIGQVFDGGLLIVIFATSGALEAVATKRTEDSVRGLLDLAPQTATRVTADGEQVVDAAQLQAGDVILVRPGERIGGDGAVIDGASDVDQATITGEPLPAPKHLGDEVFAGTLNGTGALRVRITRPAKDTVIARIVAMVEQASATKARTQLFIEKVEQRYSVGMVAVTLALFLVPLAFGAAFEPTLLRAMTFMIVASPCAVVLATMPPLLSAIANAGRHGVLVKSAVVLERLGTATRVAFDKTGTLTLGTPEVAVVKPLLEVDVLRLAAAAESQSEHPVGRAIVAACPDAAPASEFTSVPGKGVSAVVDGRLVEVGSPAHLLDRADPVVESVESSGYTAVVVKVDGVLAGVIGLTDQLRPGAADAVQRLAEMQPVLLTGDNPRAAAKIAADVGITNVQAGLLPQDKVAAVQQMPRAVVVGDGVNDAPALATAHVGIAMGRTGSDLALDTADVVITRDDLSTVPAVIALARRARRVVIANLVIAGTFICVLAGWDLFGTLPLPLGVAGHEGSTIIVGLNGLRLLRRSAWDS